MTYTEQQEAFNADLHQLILYARHQGFTLHMDTTDDLKAQIYVLDKDYERILTDPEDYVPLADFWESLSPRNRHGRSYKEPNIHLFERIKE